MSESMKIYTYGNAIEIGVTVKTTADVLVDPQNGVKITITNPLGVAVVTNQSMSNTSVGVYYYDLQTTTAFALGVYTCTITVDGASWDAVYISNRLFELVSANE